MKIIIKGLWPQKEQYITNKVNKYLKLLKIKNKVKDSTICVKFVHRAQGLEKYDCGLYRAPCTRRTSKPKNYHEIIINKIYLYSRYYILATLFHEMVHLKQWISEKVVWESYRTGCDIYVWWKKNKLGKLKDFSYENSPWEKEAAFLTMKYWKENKL